jgi:hypothetical protein
MFLVDYCNKFCRFVDRDMMMRYLGIGVGHIQPADFPHEVDALQAEPEDDYVPPAQRTESSSAHGAMESTERQTDSDPGDGSDSEESDGDEDDLLGPVYEY